MTPRALTRAWAWGMALACVLSSACGSGRRSPNLVRNPGGEEVGGAAVPGWTAADGAEVTAYGTSGFPALTDPGPPDRGSSFFSGGNSGVSTLTQAIDVSEYAAQIDAGGVSFELSAYLGGYLTQTDAAVVAVGFYDGATDLGNRARIGPVTASDRQNLTGLLRRSASGAVPPHTRLIALGIAFGRDNGAYNDGYVDNVSVVLGGI